MTIQNTTHTTEAAAAGSVKVLRKDDWALVGFVNRVGTEWHASFPGGVSTHTSRVEAFEAVSAEDNKAMAAKADRAPLDEANAVLMDIAGSIELADLLARAMKAQAATDNENKDWDTPIGRRIESAMSYLRLALEAAGR